MRVGFIGLGMMGKGMAANLQKAGFGLCGTPRSAGETDSFARGPPNQQDPYAPCFLHEDRFEQCQSKPSLFLNSCV